MCLIGYSIFLIYHTNSHIKDFSLKKTLYAGVHFERVDIGGKTADSYVCPLVPAKALRHFLLLSLKAMYST